MTFPRTDGSAQKITRDLMSLHSLSSTAPARVPPSIDALRSRRTSRPVRRTIHNVVTGLTLEVQGAEPADDILRMRATYPARSPEPPLHAHPRESACIARADR